jgi:uncharacterized protein (UPF0261 family)
MAERLNQATAPVVVVIPKGGFSFYNRDGLHFRNIEADKAFVKTLRARLRAEFQVIEIDSHVNDPPFVSEVLSILERLVQEAKKG